MKSNAFSDFGSRVQNQIKLNKFKKYVDTGLGFNTGYIQFQRLSQILN